MLFYNRTIHEIEKFSLKEKIGGYLSDKLPPCYQKERSFLFWRSQGKESIFAMLYISLLPEFIRKKTI